MVKQLSTVRNTQRDSQSYIENRRRRREIEVTRREGRVKKEESNQAINQKGKWILNIRFKNQRLKMYNRSYILTNTI